MSDDNFDYVNDVLKRKISALRGDVGKLNAVDDLIGTQATDSKKHDLLNTMFVLQEVQAEIMDERFRLQDLRHKTQIAERDS